MKYVIREVLRALDTVNFSLKSSSIHNALRDFNRRSTVTTVTEHCLR